MIDPRMIDEEVAGWIAALGLERGPEGHVRAYPGSLGTLTYVLLTPDLPRRAGQANDRLYFHHAGDALRRHGFRSGFPAARGSSSRAGHGR